MVGWHHWLDRHECEQVGGILPTTNGASDWKGKMNLTWWDTKRILLIPSWRQEHTMLCSMPPSCRERILFSVPRSIGKRKHPSREVGSSISLSQIEKLKSDESHVTPQGLRSRKRDPKVWGLSCFAGAWEQWLGCRGIPCVSCVGLPCPTWAVNLSNCGSLDMKASHVHFHSSLG